MGNKRTRFAFISGSCPTVPADAARESCQGPPTSNYTSTSIDSALEHKCVSSHVVPADASPRPMAPCSPLTPLQLLESCSADIGVQCDIIQSVTPVQQARKEVNIYTSLKVRAVISPVVVCLTLGSYRKAVKLMLTSEKETVKKQTLKDICDTVKCKCDTTVSANQNLLKQSTEEDLLNFVLRRWQRRWNVLSFGKWYV